MTLQFKQPTVLMLLVLILLVLVAGDQVNLRTRTTKSTPRRPDQKPPYKPHTAQRPPHATPRPDRPERPTRPLDDEADVIIDSMNQQAAGKAQKAYNDVKAQQAAARDTRPVHERFQDFLQSRKEA